MAEAHPVGFRWAMKARERGATIIHVDPRFSRTSAMADMHVPIRAGSDIAFIGGLINHLLQTETYFKEYVLAYTNASTLINEEFEEIELETAMDMIAERLIAARENGWQDTDDEGRRVDRTMGFAHLGGATLDNEENYLIKKAFTAMGAIQIENQARI